MLPFDPINPAIDEFEADRLLRMQRDNAHAVQTKIKVSRAIASDRASASASTVQRAFPFESSWTVCMGETRQRALPGFLQAGLL